MEVKDAKRIVALNRQIAGTLAMLKAGSITEEECALLVSDLRKQVSTLRGQDDLQLVGGSTAPEKAKKA